MGVCQTKCLTRSSKTLNRKEDITRVHYYCCFRTADGESLKLPWCSLHIKGSYVHVICNAFCRKMEIQSDLLWVPSSGHSSNSRSRQDETRYHRCLNHWDRSCSGLKTKIVLIHWNIKLCSPKYDIYIYLSIYLSGFAKTWLNKFQVHIVTNYLISKSKRY